MLMKWNRKLIVIAQVAYEEDKCCANERIKLKMQKIT